MGNNPITNAGITEEKVNHYQQLIIIYFKYNLECKEEYSYYE